MPRPLIQKLGVRPGDRVGVVDAPEAVTDLLHQQDIVFLTEGPLDFILAFALDRNMLAHHLATYTPRLAADGMCWLCWPKRASSIQTDLHREAVRDAGLASGLVDVKVCAIDADWSGLKFVYRLADR